MDANFKTDIAHPSGGIQKEQAYPFLDEAAIV